MRNGVYLDFSEAMSRLGEGAIRERYGNLFDMYERITDEDPYRVPMRIYPAVHYTMGGLWVDYHLMSNVPGLFVLGEANFSDHGANRLGASALMQGLADGYFVISYTLANYLAGLLGDPVVPTDDPAFADAERSVGDTVARLLSINGTSSVDHYHRELGKIMWDYCGMARNRSGLEKALAEIRRCARSSGRTCGAGRPGAQPVAGEGARVADFFELGELMVPSALHREESWRALPRGEPDRGRRGAAGRRALRLRRRLGVDGQRATSRPCTSEPLEFEYVKLTQRSTSSWGAPSYGPDPASGGKPTPTNRGMVTYADEAGTSAPTCPSSRCSTS